MAKKKTFQPKETTQCSRMYPSLHQDVAAAISKHIAIPRFHNNDSDDAVSRDYSTYVVGVFRCHNPTCSTQVWSSGKVTILIRKYQDGGYNAVVFNQRCKSCNRLGAFAMDKTSYVERVAYRLMKWAGVVLEQPDYGSKTSPPHLANLCEGCKRGICRAANARNQH